MKKRIIFIVKAFIILSMFFLLIKGNVSFAEDEIITFEVNNVKEWVEAIENINKSGQGKYIINLNNDINSQEIDGKLIVPNVSISVPCEVSIIGNGNTIYFPAGGGIGSGIFLSKGAILNLGKEDGSDNLTLAGSTEGNDDGGLIYVNEKYINDSMSTGATCNMYDGVTLKDRVTSNYYGAGVSVSGIKTVFNMYGGTIQNCGFSSVSSGSEVYGGGVSVMGGTFNMYDGIIKDCHALNTNDNFYGRGGGIFLTQYPYSQSKLNITGGTIENCSADVGGGIFLSYNYYPESESITNISNCKIINNHATYDGGGIYALASHINISNSEITGNDALYGGGLLLNGSNSRPSTVNMDDTCVLCNNIAVNAGSDVDAYRSTISLPVASSMNRKYLNSEPSYASQKKINGWYEDNEEDDSSGNNRYKNQTQTEAVLINEINIDATNEEKLIIAGNNGEDDSEKDDEEPSKDDEEPSKDDEEPSKDDGEPSKDDEKKDPEGNDSQTTNETIPQDDSAEQQNNNNSILNTITENQNQVLDDREKSVGNSPNTGDKITKHLIYFVFSGIVLALLIKYKFPKTKGKH